MANVFKELGTANIPNWDLKFKKKLILIESNAHRSHNEFRWFLQIHVFDDIMIGFNICAGKSFTRIIWSENYNRTSQCTLVAFERKILIGKNSSTSSKICKWFWIFWIRILIRLHTKSNGMSQYQWRRFLTKHHQRNISTDYLDRIHLDTNQSETNRKRLFFLKLFFVVFFWLMLRHLHSMDRPIACKMDSKRNRQPRIL